MAIGHHGRVPAGVDRIWVAAPGWPEPSVGWRPWPGWAPAADWPAAPADWTFWQERIDRARFLRAWWSLVVLLIIWTTGNLALAIGLRQHAVVVHRFLDGATGGSSLTNPVGLVAGVAFLLLMGLAVVAIGWFVTFGLGRSGRLSAVGVAILIAVGLVLDGVLLILGPYSTTRWWGSPSFNQVDQLHRGAVQAGAAAVVGVALLLIALLRRRRLLTK